LTVKLSPAKERHISAVLFQQAPNSGIGQTEKIHNKIFLQGHQLLPCVPCRNSSQPSRNRVPMARGYLLNQRAMQKK
jgi:hypothetical protein